MGVLRKRERDFRFRHVGRLAAPSGLDALVSVSVGPDGPVAIWSAPEDRDDFHTYDIRPNFLSFPKGRAESSPRVALVSYSGHSLTPQHQVLAAGLPVAFPLIQPLADGEFVVAGRRCWRGPEGPERNALIFGHDGSVTRTGTIGDGIEHLLVDDAGGLWTGYSDEGIFGNFGWFAAEGHPPLGEPGIVRWSTQFEKLWELRAEHCPLVADCYVLNVDSNRVWACTYVDFPILEIDSGRTRIRRTAEVDGPTAMAVSGDLVAVMGDYKRPKTLLVGSLDSPHLRRVSISMPRGWSLSTGTLVCRGPVINLFIGAEWFTFDLSQIPARNGR